MKRAGRLPLVTLILIAANIAAAFALLVDPDLAFSYGFRPDLPRIHTAFTSIFLHANVLHLLGNMVFLAAVGAAAELATGSFRFAVVYFVSGLVGVGAHFVMTRHVADAPPYIGASGAIAGCAAYYTIRYMRLRVPVAPNFAIPVAAVTGLWVLLQIAGALVRIGDTGGVAYWAHLGGFAAGVVLSFAFRAPDLGELQLGHEVLDRMNQRGPAALVAAAKEHLERHPNDPKALHDLAEAYAKLHEPAKESETLLHILDLVPAEEQPDILRRLAQIGYVTRIPVIRRLQLADKHKDEPFVARALLRSVVDGPEDVQVPDAMLSLAALEMDESPDKAQEVLRELQANYPLHPTVDLARQRGWLP